MKKWCILVVVLLLLSGCASEASDVERGLELRSALLRGQCSFETKITADYGERVHIFEMTCHGDQDGNLSFTVTQPESISGITGTISEEGGKLTFDDTALSFEMLTDDQLSPVAAPWIFLRTLRSGYLACAGREDALLRLTIDDSYEEDALTLDIWITEENIPVRAEVLYDGRGILSLDVTNFVIL